MSEKEKGGDSIVMDQ